MSTRFLAFASGATVGLAVGVLVGQATRDAVTLARLSRQVGASGVAVRPREARSGVPAPRETPEGLNGPQIGAQPIPAQREGTLDVGDLHDRPDYREALARAEQMPWGEPGVDLTEWLDEHAACTQRSPGGGLVCCQKGAHRMHRFEGTSAPDRKDDTDEGIE